MTKTNPTGICLSNFIYGLKLAYAIMEPTLSTHLYGMLQWDSKIEKYPATNGIHPILVKPVAAPKPISGSVSYASLPHLMKNHQARCPAFQILSPRISTDIDLVIGIPTVKPVKETHLYDTVKSLIDGMTSEELTRTLIVIFIGEVEDLGYVIDTAYTLNMMFNEYFGKVIEVISPTKYWYPDWSHNPSPVDGIMERVHWWSKQNLDAVFLMSYAQDKGSYYLMLEDDTIAKTNFRTKMFEFIGNETRNNTKWIMINFNDDGGYGKLFKPEDLGHFSTYVQLLFSHVPLNWLLEIFLSSQVCGLTKVEAIRIIFHYEDQPRLDYNERQSERCTESKNEVCPTYEEQLFKHAGLLSSLKGETHTIKIELLVENDVCNPELNFFRKQ